MNALHIEVLRLLAQVEILNAAMGQLQGVSQVRGAVIPGPFQFRGGDAQRVRSETIELFGQCHQSLITLAAHTLDDGFNRGRGIPLGLSGGACGDPIELLLRLCCAVKAPGQTGRLLLSAQGAHRRLTFGSLQARALVTPVGVVESLGYGCGLSI